MAAISNVRVASLVRSVSASKMSFKGNTLKVNLGSNAKQLTAGKKLNKMA